MYVFCCDPSVVILRRFAGVWFQIINREHTKVIFTGKDREAADKFYYDVKR